MKNKTELKPCPFCGGKAELQDDGYSWRKAELFWVVCISCGAKTAVRSTKRAAKKHWDRRVDNG